MFAPSCLKKTYVLKGSLRLKPNSLLGAILFIVTGLPSVVHAADPSRHQASGSDPVVFKLRPERKAGRGYKLTYVIDAPLDAVWRFKTHFENQNLLKNKFINSHRVVSRDRNEVVTETEYSNKPRQKFKWKTTILPEQHVLNFVLLNPEKCGQKYHHGYIQLEAIDNKTRVTQVAYFNFFGVSLWVNYPFKGGMSHFLKYTANWEQYAVLDSLGNHEE